jgi:hypothetical protein
MKISAELEKIVNKGILQYKVFKDAEDMISHIKMLDQAKEDLEKIVKDLTSEKLSLEAKVKALPEKLLEAEKEAAFILDKSKKEAQANIEKAEGASALIKKNAEENMKSINLRIENALNEAKKADLEALKAKDKLNEINKTLNDAKERAQKLLG